MGESGRSGREELDGREDADKESLTSGGLAELQ